MNPRTIQWLMTYDIRIWLKDGMWKSNNEFGFGSTKFWDNLTLKSYSKYTNMMDMLELGRWK